MCISYKGHYAASCLQRCLPLILADNYDFTIICPVHLPNITGRWIIFPPWLCNARSVWRTAETQTSPTSSYQGGRSPVCSPISTPGIFH
jgi:hypothetical protein